MAVMNAMKSINPATGMVTSSVNRRKQAIAQLASYIKFEEPSLPVIVKTLRNFRSAVDKLFRDPVDELKRNIGNADRLADEETSFIRRADYLKGLSQELFIRLAGSITCSGVHKAQLHLSGFLASDATFELCIPDCTGRHWRLAKCRRRLVSQGFRNSQGLYVTILLEAERLRRPRCALGQSKVFVSGVRFRRNRNIHA